ncbi:MAG: glycosyltransferase family 2 protein [Flavobacteriaceae bacterium]|nr:glycosyltransferase family 2 protein [Flavobacteriaceae bacterium]
MHNHKVTIIIPIYNVEKYIKRCVVSLFEQDFEDIEYIFVNDCTPDNSVGILEKTIEKYPNRKPNVTVTHHKENKGLGWARNTGVKQATGEYILHIDNDDWCELDMVSSLYNKAKETDADIVGCDFIKHFKSNKEVVIKQNYGTTKKQNFTKILLGKEKEISPNVWNKLVKRDLYIKNNIYPPTQINFAEDWWLMVRLFSVAEKTSVVPKALYHYNRANADAITMNMSEKNWKDFHWYIITTQQFLEESGLFQNYKDYFYKGILNTVLREGTDKFFTQRINSLCPKANKLKYVWQIPHYNLKMRVVNSLYVLNLFGVLKFLKKVKRFLK